MYLLYHASQQPAFNTATLRLILDVHVQEERNDIYDCFTDSDEEYEVKCQKGKKGKRAAAAAKTKKPPAKTQVRLH